MRCDCGDGEEGLFGDGVEEVLLCANENYPNYARRLLKFIWEERLLIYARVISEGSLIQAARPAVDPPKPILFWDRSPASALISVRSGE